MRINEIICECYSDRAAGGEGEGECNSVRRDPYYQASSSYQTWWISQNLSGNNLVWQVLALQVWLWHSSTVWQAVFVKNFEFFSSCNIFEGNWIIFLHFLIIVVFFYWYWLLFGQFGAFWAIWKREWKLRNKRWRDPRLPPFEKVT